LSQGRRHTGDIDAASGVAQAIKEQKFLGRTMLKKYTWPAVAIVLLTFVMFVSSVTALELDEASRTVSQNERGDTIVMSTKQLVNGKKQFNYACSSCHGQGMTKTNPNVGLDLETLSLATPPRDNIQGLVDFLQIPKSFDGEVDISEYHPGIKSADVFPKMRNMTEDDLVDLAGYMLAQPQIESRWAAGKGAR
jgi:photosystem II cytochrome c550